MMEAANSMANDMSEVGLRKIISLACLASIPGETVPAATVVLHECLVHADVSCALEFQRLPIVERLIFPGLETTLLQSSATIAGIRLGGGLFNVRGQAPLLDTAWLSNRKRYYLSWERDENLGFLSRREIDKVRKTWQSVMQSAVDRVVLEEKTQVSQGCLRFSRL